MNRMMTQDGYTAALRQDKARVCAEGSPQNKTCIIGSHLLFRSASDADLHDGSGPGQRQGRFAFPLRGLSDPGWAVAPTLGTRALRQALRPLRGCLRKRRSPTHRS